MQVCDRSVDKFATYEQARGVLFDTLIAVAGEALVANAFTATIAFRILAVGIIMAIHLDVARH